MGPPLRQILRVCGSVRRILFFRCAILAGKWVFCGDAEESVDTLRWYLTIGVDLRVRSVGTIAWFRDVGRIRIRPIDRYMQSGGKGDRFFQKMLGNFRETWYNNLDMNDNGGIAS